MEKDFSLNPVQFSFPGELFLACVGNNIVCVVCRVAQQNGHEYRLLKIDLLNSENVESVPIKLKKPGDSPQCIFLHPFGTHLLLVSAKGDTYHCLFGRQNAKKPKKLKFLSQLQGLHIICVAWTQPSKRNGLSMSGSTGLVLAGSANGSVYEMELHPNDDYFKRNARFVRLLATMPHKEPVCSVGLASFPVAAEKFLAVVATPTRLYSAVGNASVSPYERNGTAIPSLQPLFKSLVENPVYQEFPLAFPQTRFMFFSPFNQEDGWPSTPQSFLWQTMPGIYYGTTALNDEKSTSETIFTGTGIFPYPQRSDVPTIQLPEDSLLIPYHFVLLYKDCTISVIWSLDFNVSWSSKLPPVSSAADSAAPVLEETIIHGMLDPVTRTSWVVTNLRLVELQMDNPERNVWQYYLQKEQYELALSHAAEPEQKSLVLYKQGEKHFSLGRYSLAARCFAESKFADFDDICSKYLARDEYEGLTVFLQLKIEQDGAESDKKRLANWLIRLSVREIEFMRSENLNDEVFVQDEERLLLLKHRREELELSKHALFEFALKWIHVLDIDEVIALLAKHDLEQLAEAICTHLDRQAESVCFSFGHSRVPERKPAQMFAQEPLIKLFAPLFLGRASIDELRLLIQKTHCRADLWLPLLSTFSIYDMLRTGLKRTLPLVLKRLFSENEGLQTDSDWCSFALVVLVHSRTSLDEAKGVLSVIRAAHWLPALHLARTYEATVPETVVLTPLLLQSVGQLEEAVYAALASNDISLAEQQALQVPLHSLSMLSRLWKHILAAKSTESNWSIAESMAFVRQTLQQLERQYHATPSVAATSPMSETYSNGLVSSVPIAMLNDVLQLGDVLAMSRRLPPIESILGEVRQTFAHFHKRLENLDFEKTRVMHNMSKWTDWLAVRNQSSIVVKASALCRFCELTLFSRQCYSFPSCGHQFHADCLLTKVAKQLGSARNGRLLELRDKLSDLVADKESPKNRIEAIKMEIDEIIAKDCPKCSLLFIESLYNSLNENDSRDHSRVSSFKL